MTDNQDAGRVDAAGSDDVRVQYRLDLATGHTGEGDLTDCRTGVVVDVETTGTGRGTNAVVELAVRRFRFDADGVIAYLDHPHSWREDPGVPLPTDVTRRTGLRDEGVAGRRIDDAKAQALLRSAALVIAHDAAFVRPAVERRFPDLGDLDWACSMTQIDWTVRSFDGRSLGYLLRQAGWFHDANRASSDVDAVLQLLRQDLRPGRAALAELAKRALACTWLIRAVGAPYAFRETLRSRRYRWDPEGRVWWKEVEDTSRDAEERWLIETIYSRRGGATAGHVQVSALLASDRFR